MKVETKTIKEQFKKSVEYDKQAFSFFKDSEKNTWVVGCIKFNSLTGETEKMERIAEEPSRELAWENYRIVSGKEYMKEST